jgi:hypothetical protein
MAGRFSKCRPAVTATAIELVENEQLASRGYVASSVTLCASILIGESKADIDIASLGPLLARLYGKAGSKLQSQDSVGALLQLCHSLGFGSSPLFNSPSGRPGLRSYSATHSVNSGPLSRGAAPGDVAAGEIWPFCALASGLNFWSAGPLTYISLLSPTDTFFLSTVSFPTPTF